MSKDEKSQMLHQIVSSAEQEQQETADPSIIPVTNTQIEESRMK